jgi:divalent metal cation (Fe/Co/Zn/Cd) transporter
LFPSTNLQWVDPVAAIGVALLIVRAAYDLTVQSGKDLLDASLNPEDVIWIRQLITQHCPPVCGYHRLRTRKSGADRFVEFHLLVKGSMSVDASHALTDDLAEHIEDQFPHTSVTIHIEPCNGFCSPVCIEGCLLSEEERAAMKRKHRERYEH